ncbi:MAG TPA: DUF3558 domain-containing protein [Mycobacterium sp.]|nr:DUF3558 domain-containing protein [Mycobacterium sp.]
MRWRVNPVAIAAVTAVVAVAGCSQTVGGIARRAQTAVPDPTRSYGYVDDRCGLLADGSIQQALGADHIVRPYSGAVCQYVLSRGSGPDAGAPAGIVDVTFSWYETGNLDRERALATERGATITEKIVERHPAFLARRDMTGAACSATAAAGTGVLSWWVQFRGQRTGDPCKDAEKLLTATLQSDL